MNTLEYGDLLAATLALYGDCREDAITGEIYLSGSKKPLTQKQLKAVQQKSLELQEEAKKTFYVGLRKAAYAKLNQFDMQFNDARDGTTTWIDAINEIKAKYPKGCVE